MRHLLRLTDLSGADLAELFGLADRYRDGLGEKFSGAAVLFFPPSSLRTRVSFELGVAEMGLHPITFPPETLDRNEDVADVVGYLANWARLSVVRHRDLGVLERMAGTNAVPIVNAMTDDNHPCEVLSDLYALSQDGDGLGLRYVFVGGDGNISRAWGEASRAFGLSITQSCPQALRTPGMPWEPDLRRAVSAADVLITDGPGPYVKELAPYRITADVLESAPRGVRLSPCPPFVRGREVSTDAIEAAAFVGYDFKKSLKPMQQAVIAWSLQGGGPHDDAG